jgi:hypothetical protein
MPRNYYNFLSADALTIHLINRHLHELQILTQFRNFFLRGFLSFVEKWTRSKEGFAAPGCGRAKNTPENAVKSWLRCRGRRYWGSSRRERGALTKYVRVVPEVEDDVGECQSRWPENETELVSGRMRVVWLQVLTFVLWWRMPMSE